MPRPLQHRQSGAQPQSVLILANPTSGGYQPQFLEAVRQKLEAGGCHTRIHLTSRAGEIGEICADPTLAVNVLAIAGGDGSINEALTGFQTNPAPPDLAVIPFGTANVLAQELKLPFSASAIAEMIQRRRSAPLHMGLANGRPFMLMASAGFDAEVVHGISLALKRRLGKLAYVLTALKLAFSRESRTIKVLADDREFAGKLVIATNGRCYGGSFVICPDAAVTSAGLYLLVLQRDDFLSTFRFGLALALGRIHKARGVTLVPFERAEFTADKPVAAQIDGDPFATTPLLLEQAPDTINILVP